MANYDDENYPDSNRSTWFAHLRKLLGSFIIAVICLVIFYYNLKKLGINNFEDAPWAILVFYVGGLIFLVIAAWYALISILWPVLVFFGLVGVASAKTAASSVKSLDEGGGLRSIVHRIWYGKNGPPN